MKDSSTADVDFFIERFHAYWMTFSKQLQLSDVQSQMMYQRLLEAYTEPQRAYHTVQHIVECLDLFYKIEHELSDPIAVQLAIWFHDAIYDPKSSDNELNSAKLMKDVSAAYLDQSTIEKVYAWILATQQHQPSFDSDLNYLLDIDLAILASDSNRFAEYEQQIQFEYAWVDPEIYQIKRAEVLTQFYQMQPLFQTTYFQNNFEQPAKLNLMTFK